MINDILSNKSIVAVSNYIISENTEYISSKYDFIIRFNVGSNEHILNRYEFYNGKTNLCCLSGWIDGYFGPLVAFKDKTVLFSRPKCENSIKYFYKDICVTNEFENKIKAYTDNLFYIPLDVFYQFYDEYNYDHPTTGLILLYYIKRILNLNIDVINFFIDPRMVNYFIKTDMAYHKLDLERKIFKSLSIDNIITEN